MSVCVFSCTKKLGLWTHWPTLKSESNKISNKKTTNKLLVSYDVIKMKEKLCLSAVFIWFKSLVKDEAEFLSHLMTTFTSQNLSFSMKSQRKMYAIYPYLIIINFRPSVVSCINYSNDDIETINITRICSLTGHYMTHRNPM